MRWFAMSTRFLEDPKIGELGAQHGPAGPLLVVALLTAAGAADEGGRVTASYRNLAHDVFIDREQVGPVLDSALELGICHGLSRDGHGVSVEFPEWEKWQAAWRKARQRARAKEDEKPLEQANVTNGHGASRSVPYKTKQNRTEQDLPLAPSGGIEF